MLSDKIVACEKHYRMLRADRAREILSHIFPVDLSCPTVLSLLGLIPRCIDILET